MDRKITITNAEGKSVVGEIITIFKIDELNSDYIVYTFNQRDETGNIKDYVSKLRAENGKYYFDSIDDANEWEKVKLAIDELGKGGA